MGHRDMIITSLTQHTLNRHGTRALELLTEYWTKLASSGDIPLWSEVDPGQIQDALDHAFLAERFGHCHARIRVAGGGVEDMAGQRCPGLPLSLLIQAADRAVFNDAMTSCCSGRVVDIALTCSPDAANREVTARMVLFPLRDTGGIVRQFLGGLAPVGDATVQVGGFGVTKLSVHPATARWSKPRLVVDNT